MKFVILILSLIFSMSNSNSNMEEFASSTLEFEVISKIKYGGEATIKVTNSKGQQRTIYDKTICNHDTKDSAKKLLKKKVLFYMFSDETIDGSINYSIFECKVI